MWYLNDEFICIIAMCDINSIEVNQIRRKVEIEEIKYSKMQLEKKNERGENYLLYLLNDI